MFRFLCDCFPRRNKTREKYIVNESDVTARDHTITQTNLSFFNRRGTGTGIKYTKNRVELITCRYENNSNPAENLRTRVNRAHKKFLAWRENNERDRKRLEENYNKDIRGNVEVKCSVEYLIGDENLEAAKNKIKKIPVIEIFQVDVHKPAECLSEWLTNRMPSFVFSFSTVRCLEIQGASFNVSDYRPSNVIDLLEEIQLTNLNYSWKETLQLAKSYNIFSGKWLMHIYGSKTVDDIWCKIVKRIAEDEFNGLSNYALIACFDQYLFRVILIFNKDYTNEENVYALEDALRRIGVTHSLFYKPDVYSYAEPIAKHVCSTEGYTLVSTYNYDTMQSKISKPVITKKIRHLTY